jgi:hypothetical protein
MISSHKCTHGNCLLSGVKSCSYLKKCQKFLNRYLFPLLFRSPLIDCIRKSPPIKQQKLIGDKLMFIYFATQKWINQRAAIISSLIASSMTSSNSSQSSLTFKTWMSPSSLSNDETFRTAGMVGSLVRVF